ncbi:unnamed protein product, partial [Polarella glacialis]
MIQGSKSFNNRLLQLCDVHGIEIEEQVLKFRGRELEDKETLASCGVMAGSSLLLGLRRAANSDPAKPADALT